jgi:hypothetical protein
VSSHQKKEINVNPAKNQATHTKSDLLKILSAMEKALCRQHIMWPHDGDLPCELLQPCEKKHLCSQMAEDVMDLKRRLNAASED